MTLPRAHPTGDTAGQDAPAAGSFSLGTLTKRSDFLRAARARRVVTPGFVLQIRDRGDEDPAVRVGFTCSKKVGNAVARNRAKRRLRAAAWEILQYQGVEGWDYVLIGRPDATVSRPFAILLDDLQTALAKVHAPRKARA